MSDLNQFAKREIALRYWLQGRGYSAALRALELLKLFEDGNVRKDGVSPVISHMIEIALHVSRLPGIRDMETMLVVCLLHDLVEDHGVSLDIVRQLFGDRVATAISALSKKIPVFNGGESIDIGYLTVDGSPLTVNKGGHKVGSIERDEDELYDDMARDEFASIAKMADRGHNQTTMAGVFGAEKQMSYVDFTDARILPMAKIARRRFPHQEGAYVILENLLRTQARIVRGWAKAAA